MPPSEHGQRAATSDLSTAPAPDDGARALSDEIVELARALPGDLRRLTVRSGDRAIEVEWAPDALAVSDGSRTAPGFVPARPDPTSGEQPASEIPEGICVVRAPLVGTFYAAPSPGADPFVRVGDEIESGQTLGIVEAMKLMNPILADEPGVVTEIFVSDTESVEYDQVLAYLRPPGRPR
jgi:acetyl-CoA carboxylase biotin carboxyl carrier protein